MGTGESGIVQSEAGQPRSKSASGIARQENGKMGKWENGGLTKYLMENVYVPQMGIKADRRQFRACGSGQG